VKVRLLAPGLAVWVAANAWVYVVGMRDQGSTPYWWYVAIIGAGAVPSVLAAAGLRPRSIFICGAAVLGIAAVLAPALNRHALGACGHGGGCGRLPQSAPRKEAPGVRQPLVLPPSETVIPLPGVFSGISRVLMDNRLTRSAQSQPTNTSLCKRGGGGSRPRTEMLPIEVIPDYQSSQ
jgi:hypothetical protein